MVPDSFALVGSLHGFCMGWAQVTPAKARTSSTASRTAWAQSLGTVNLSVSLSRALRHRRMMMWVLTLAQPFREMMEGFS
jgi:hypothetical protein